MKTLGIVIATLLLLALPTIIFFVGGVNKVVTMDEAVTASWAQVENQLQRRNDLIPNLVNTVKGYAAHEKEVFEHIADARARLAGTISSDKPIAERIEAAQELNGWLSRLLVIVERYPDLKANENFMRLQDELAGTENRIAVERMRYNQSVEQFNAHIRRIPGSFFANLKKLGKHTYFQVAETAKQVPLVAF